MSLYLWCRGPCRRLLEMGDFARDWSRPPFYRQRLCRSCAKIALDTRKKTIMNRTSVARQRETA